MSLNLDFEIDFGQESIKRFLYTQTSPEYFIEPPIESGFSFVDPKADWRDESNEPRFNETETVPLLVNEHWGVEENGVITAVNHAIVTLECDVDISPTFYLHLKDGLDSSDQASLRDLFRNYSVAQHGPNIRQYIRDNMADQLSEDMFRVETGVKLWNLSQLRDREIRQRLALFALFNCKFMPPNPHDASLCTVSSIRTRMHIPENSEDNFQRWAATKRLSLLKMRTELWDRSEPERSASVQEIKPGTDPDRTVDEIILREIFPTRCVDMEPKKHKIASIFNWPEFKVDWRRKRIKIGCARITITYPVLQHRTAKLFLYAYYSLPNKTDQFIWAIAETCAKRSAMYGAVVGIILSNPGAALAAFKSMFIRCVENDIRECVSPGLATIKEPDDWQDV